MLGGNEWLGVILAPFAEVGSILPFTFRPLSHSGFRPSLSLRITLRCRLTRFPSRNLRPTHSGTAEKRPGNVGIKTFMFLLSTEENAEHCSKEHGLPRLLPCIFRLSLPSGTEFKELEVERQSQGAFAFGDCIPNVTNCVHCP